MHIFLKNFSGDELRLIFGRYPCQEVEYIFFKKLLAMHSTLYFRLKHVNALRCILMSILSPREQRERSKLMVTDTRRSEAVLNFLQDCNTVRLRESQIIRHHNRIHIGLLTKKSLLGHLALRNSFYRLSRLMSAEETPSCSHRRRGSLMQCAYEQTRCLHSQAPCEVNRSYAAKLPRKP